MDFHFRAFCILQYIEKKQILLHMPFVKCLKVLKILSGLFLLRKFPVEKPDTEK